MKAVYYRIDQSLPPRHWYQRRVGWFGKTLGMVIVLTVASGTSYAYIQNKNAVKSFAAETNSPQRLKKVTGRLGPTTAENIIDIQYVLDKWAENHPDQKWSVVAKSIDGANFEARLNADKQYDSQSARQLLMAVPLYSQIPAEHQKKVQVQASGTKTMATCVDLMIRLGNSACESVIGGYVDWKKAGEELKKAGLSNTKLDSKAAKTTASDMAAYLLYIQGESMQRTSRDTLIKYMKQHYYRKGIPAGCPGCSTANKANPADGVVYDAAIVDYNGGAYVLTVFTPDGSLEDIRQLAGAIQQKIIDSKE